jgi:hypothetical protein
MQIPQSRTNLKKTRGRLDINKANYASKKMRFLRRFVLFHFKKWAELIFNPFRVDLLYCISLFPPVSLAAIFVQPLRG